MRWRCGPICAAEIQGQGRDMTDRAKKIVENARNRMLFQNPRAREKTVDEFNRSTLDDVGPIGEDKGEKFLSDLNEMADLERDAGRKENPDR